MANLNSICVFCGASNAVEPDYLEEGRRFGKLLVERGIRLIYGGGDCGIMGAVASSVMDHGGWVTGVFPRGLQRFEKEHTGLSEILIVDSMHERKKAMFDRSDAFVSFPGGFGTLDETFEIITWRQLQIHSMPIIMYNYRNYWDPWIKLADHIIGHKFAREETASYYTVVNTMEGILDAAGWQPEDLVKP